MRFDLNVMELGRDEEGNTSFPPSSVSIHGNKEIYLFDRGFPS